MAVKSRKQNRNWEKPTHHRDAHCTANEWTIKPFCGIYVIQEVFIMVFSHTSMLKHANGDMQPPPGDCDRKHFTFSARVYC